MTLTDRDASDQAPEDVVDGPEPPPSTALLWIWRQARRLVVFVIGSTVLLLGLLMVLGPGPAIVVIPAGLTILATEFVWARRLLNYAKQHLAFLANQMTKTPDKSASTPADGNQSEPAPRNE